MPTQRSEKLSTVEEETARILEAASYAARRHAGQRRADGSTPYIAHPFRVGWIARKVFGLKKPAAIAAALLHDVIEDCDVHFSTIEKKFGTEIAEAVVALSKNPLLREEAREEDYLRRLKQAPEWVRILKLADAYDNLTDRVGLKKEKRTLQKAQEYLEALETTMATAEGKRAIEIVRRLHAEVERMAGGRHE